jgi:hypothetical protein
VLNLPLPIAHFLAGDVWPLYRYSSVRSREAAR